MDNDIHFGDQVHRQAHGHGMLANFAQGLRFDLLGFDLHPDFLPHRFRQHLRVDRTVQAPCLTGFGRKGEQLTVQLFRDAAHLFIDASAFLLTFFANPARLLDGALGGQDGQALRHKIVSGITRGDFFDIPRAPQFIDIFK